MEPSEIEFLAENELVEIVPNFTLNAVYLLCGTFGPFEPAVRQKVPLWMALALRAKQRCRLCPPDWMTVDSLARIKEQEEAEPLFTAMPSSHYREVTALLLEHSGDDIPQAEEVRCLVKDIWDLRMSKLRGSFDLFIKSDAASAKLTHLTRMEICTMRAYLTKSLDQIFVLKYAASSLPRLVAARAAKAAKGGAGSS